MLVAIRSGLDSSKREPDKDGGPEPGAKASRGWAAAKGPATPKAAQRWPRPAGLLTERVVQGGALRSPR